MHEKVIALAGIEVTPNTEQGINSPKRSSKL
jgi:hypothetical protein